MAYKYSVGERKFGDIKAQDDAEGDTLIDFGEDCIILCTGGQNRIKISGSNGDITFNNAFTFPTTDGNTNQVLTTDGQGNLSFQAVATGDGANPPGGSNRQVQFNDNGSFAGISDITVDEGGTLTLGAITLPNTDGAYGQVLKTDGSGSLSWQDESGGSSSDIENGTWTPGLEHGYSLQGTVIGRYQKVGNQVTVWYKFNVGSANSGATEEMKLTGLPYQASTAGIWSTGPQPQGLSYVCTTQVRNGESVIRFMDQTQTSAKQISNLANEDAVRGSITYWVG